MALVSLSSFTQPAKLTGVFGTFGGASSSGDNGDLLFNHTLVDGPSLLAGCGTLLFGPYSLRTTHYVTQHFALGNRAKRLR